MTTKLRGNKHETDEGKLRYFPKRRPYWMPHLVFLDSLKRPRKFAKMESNSIEDYKDSKMQTLDHESSFSLKREKF